tara:strand:- start:275 stop:520 length:246 start_codon:yes stop_codon:yes gene_type:complete
MKIEPCEYGIETHYVNDKMISACCNTRGYPDNPEYWSFFLSIDNTYSDFSNKETLMRVLNKIIAKEELLEELYVSHLKEKI